MVPLVILHHSKVGETGEMKALFDEKPSEDDMLEAAVSMFLFGNTLKEELKVTQSHDLPLREGEEGLCRMWWEVEKK